MIPEAKTKLNWPLIACTAGVAYRSITSYRISVQIGTPFLSNHSITNIKSCYKICICAYQGGQDLSFEP